MDPYNSMAYLKAFLEFSEKSVGTKIFFMPHLNNATSL
jgi:hypothetical protein